MAADTHCRCFVVDFENGCQGFVPPGFKTEGEDLEVFIFVQKGSGAALQQHFAGDRGRLKICIKEAASSKPQAADAAIAVFLPLADLPRPVALVTGKDRIYPALVEELRAKHRNVEHIVGEGISILSLFPSRACTHCVCVFASADALAEHNFRAHLCPVCRAGFADLPTLALA